MADTDNAAAAPTKTVGQVLAAERERQGLSRADVAQRLHMSAYQVEALENGDYGRLPKGTFLRGFVRNYAKVLGLAADRVMPLIPEDQAVVKKPGLIVPSQGIRFDPLGDRLQSPYVRASVIALVLVSIGFAALYWWFFVRGKPPTSRATPVAVAEAPAPAPVAATPPAAPSPTPVFVPAKPEPAARAPVVAPPPPAPPKVEERKPEVARAPGDSNLKLRFKGQSWVEIRDGKGRLLLSRLNPAGSEAEVSGRPPFNVIVGNAPEVQLFYNDREFDLEPHTKVAVARFTVE